MQNVAELIDQKFLDRLRNLRIRTFRMNAERLVIATIKVLQRRRFDEFPRLTLIPMPAGVDLSMIALAGRVIEELVDQLGRRSNLADAQRRLSNTFQGETECSHMGDLPRHQKLQCILGAGIAAEIDQTLINDLGARLGGDVTAQI